MRRRLLWGLAIAAVFLAILWLGGGGATSSALSRDAAGWLAAHRYLEARGTEIQLHDRPLTSAVDTPVLVLAFPWQQPIADGEIEALGTFLRDGGTVLLAYSGEIGSFQEERVFEALQLLTIEARSAPPLSPLSWWRYHRAEWRLEPTADAAGWPALAMAGLRGAPEAPLAARVLYRSPSGTPLVFDYALHRGRVVALPVELLANAQLAEAGNVDLLETLAAWLDGGWSFDEYHHGLVAAEVAAASSSRFAWDLFIVHLALIYLLGLLALGRRFGPVWREAPVASGSAASFLRGLGALHRKMAHHAEAASLLIERARAYLPGLPLDDEAERRAAGVAGDRELVALAGEVARAQRGRRLQTL